MFFVLNKQKIYTYIVSLIIIAVLFIISIYFILKGINII